MTRRMWQRAMIGLARSHRMTCFMQQSRATSFLSRRFVAGGTPADAVDYAQNLLAEHGIRSSLFYLGEYVDDRGKVSENLRNKLDVATLLAGSGLDLHISVDPTQIGYQVDPALSYANAESIAARIRAGIGNRVGAHCLMFDMEDAAVVDPTIALHDHLHAQGYPVALTLQAYLRRTLDDLEAQVAQGARVRLVKGAFAADGTVAHRSQQAIKANFRKLIARMLSRRARDQGFYPIIATHDTDLHGFARTTAADHGWSPGEYEFEMLLGVRSDVARALAAQGERVRLYTPFGRDWWPYAVRRIGENRRNAILLARSLIA